jgi:hypothetical protein
VVPHVIVVVVHTLSCTWPEEHLGKPTQEQITLGMHALPQALVVTTLVAESSAATLLQTGQPWDQLLYLPVVGGITIWSGFKEV